MDALSPRSTNLPLKTKTTMQKARTERLPPHAQKSSASKHHAAPPPPVVTEPGEDGERYETGPYLGKGGFAVCYEGRLIRNGRVFAMKVVKSEMPQKKMEEKFRTELQIHSKMKHPYIVEFHRAFAFGTDTFVILELCQNGSVMDMVKKRKFLSLPEVRRFMLQLCGAVKYLHRRNVAHRDLKMGNLFLDHKMDIKVGDFGLAALIITEKDERRRRTLCGTPNYIAPEVLDKSKGGHTQKVDIWSLGVICFAMLTGYPPFQSKTQEEIYRKVRNLAYVWPKDSDGGNHIPIEAKTLVSSCLSLSEDERPEADQIAEHDFFNMYPGCLPRELEPQCRLAKPVWLRNESPMGDSILSGYSLEYDRRYAAKVNHLKDPEERYSFCRDEFYAECGVGRTPAGTFRKPVGKNSSRSAYSECLSEDEKGLQPIVPMPRDWVYRYRNDYDRDWSLPRQPTPDDSMDPVEEELESESDNASLQYQAINMARTQNALAAQMRRKESQPISHAATLRQQALPNRPPPRKAATLRGPPSSGMSEEADGRNERMPPPMGIQGGFADRPIRATRSRTALNYSASLRDIDKLVAPPMPAPMMPKTSSVPTDLNVAKTRSQARQQAAAQSAEQPQNAPLMRIEVEHPATRSRTERQPYEGLRSASGRPTRGNPREAEPFRSEPPRSEPPRSEPPRSETPRLEPTRPEPVRTETIRGEPPRAREQAPADTYRRAEKPIKPNGFVAGSVVSSGSSSGTTTSSKSRSALGLSPLIHSEEPAELLPRTSHGDVISDVNSMLSSISRAPSMRTTRRRQNSSRGAPHPYVVKWVDYTNRYGIGYVLDDGSVGCVFKAENGRPASGVIVRDGERHIRRKCRSQESREKGQGSLYSEVDQLVPRNGKPVEFYENCCAASDCLRGGRGLKRALVPPKVFEVKGSSNGMNGTGVRVRMDAGIEYARAEAEKVKRVKLVDQFGKYMIGSLGRGGEEATIEDEPEAPTRDGQYVKFYQRLGNVGVWGFGDGAFQFNFPDHTKLVLSNGGGLLRREQSEPPLWIDFYHLSPSAARYLASKGKMHPNGFDTRAVISEEANVFLAAISSTPVTTTRLHDILQANSFPDKIEFVKKIFGTWLKCGRLGGRPSPKSNSSFREIFWEGAQERPSGSGGKFVWVTVGAQGGDGEYISVSIRGDNAAPTPTASDRANDDAMEELRERLQALGR